MSSDSRTQPFFASARPAALVTRPPPDVRANTKAGPDRRIGERRARRGMKMVFEGSVRSGPNVWFIRDRGLHWENADG
jgi:hypothetical protein